MRTDTQQEIPNTKLNKGFARISKCVSDLLFPILPDLASVISVDKKLHKLWQDCLTPFKGDEPYFLHQQNFLPPDIVYSDKNNISKDTKKLLYHKYSFELKPEAGQLTDLNKPVIPSADELKMLGDIKDKDEKKCLEDILRRYKVTMLKPIPESPAKLELLLRFSHKQIPEHLVANFENRFAQVEKIMFSQNPENIRTKLCQAKDIIKNSSGTLLSPSLVESYNQFMTEIGEKFQELKEPAAGLRSAVSAIEKDPQGKKIGMLKDFGKELDKLDNILQKVEKDFARYSSAHSSYQPQTGIA